MLCALGVAEGNPCAALLAFCLVAVTLNRRWLEWLVLMSFAAQYPGGPPDKVINAPVHIDDFAS